jgi:glycosyltransferase involved in cell wall biosynthesis
MESVDVVIGTYGNFELWRALAERAVASVHHQSCKAYEIHAVHAESLAEARNLGALDGDSEWIIFLDADDELDDHYVAHMLAGEGDIRWPSTLGVVDGREDDYPVLLQPKSSMLIGNHMVIGSMVRRKIFEDVCGFRELPCLEDWDLWIRMMLAGAAAAPCPGAIYRVHVRSASRNQDAGLHGRTYQEIQSLYQGQWAERFHR